MAKNDLQGALDLLILKTLSQLDSMHGYGIMMNIRRVSESLYVIVAIRNANLVVCGERALLIDYGAGTPLRSLDYSRFTKGRIP